MWIEGRYQPDLVTCLGCFTKRCKKMFPLTRSGSLNLLCKECCPTLFNWRNPEMTKGKPEALVQATIVNRLRAQGWYVMKMHGNEFQKGFPDLFCSHKDHGIKLIEVKRPGMKGSSFTDAQLKAFPEMTRNGAPVYVITGAEDHELRKIFGKSNWWTYLKAYK